MNVDGEAGGASTLRLVRWGRVPYGDAGEWPGARKVPGVTTKCFKIGLPSRPVIFARSTTLFIAVTLVTSRARI